MRTFKARSCLTPAIVTMAMLATSAGSYAGGPGEPNGTIAQATPTGIAGTGCFGDSAQIGSPQDVDIYQVVCDGDTHLSVLAGEADIVVRVFSYDPNTGAWAELAANSELADRFGDAGASVAIAAGATYYVGISGEGNDGYDPVTGAGTQPGATGGYSAQIGCGADSGFASPEVNDSINSATIPVNTGGPGAYAASETGFGGDGPWAECFGDADFYLVAGAELTPGNVLVAQLVSGPPQYMVIYETDGDAAGTPATFAKVVAVRDDDYLPLCSAVISGGVNYAILVQTEASSFSGGLFPRNPAVYAMDYVPYDPLTPGTGDFCPQWSCYPGPATGSYDLHITEIPGPGTLGPHEPNDSLALASANATIPVAAGEGAVATSAYLGDGRWGWSRPGADADFYELTGLLPGDVFEAKTRPLGTSTVSPNGMFMADEQWAGSPYIRLIYPSGGAGVQLVAEAPASGPYHLLATPDDQSAGFWAQLMPWDVTLPGTLLRGWDAYTGAYELSVRVLQPPPAPPAGSRLWGAFRGADNDRIIEIDPATGEEIPGNEIDILPGLVDGDTGLAYAVTPPGHTTDVIYFLNPRPWPPYGYSYQTVTEYDPGTRAEITRTNLLDDAFINQHAGGPGNTQTMDALGYAGAHLWMANNAVNKIFRWNTTSRLADAVIDCQGGFGHQCRDGMEGTDATSLGSGSVLYVADRGGRAIWVLDVGPNGNGPADDGVYVELGQMDDPTWDGGSGIGNAGGIGLIRCHLFGGDINGYVISAINRCGGGGSVYGVVAPGFGASALTAFAPPLPGDFDGDGDVDLDDFGAFAACYNGAARPPAGTCPPGVDADLDGDGDVDLDDFAIFAANYTGSL